MQQLVLNSPLTKKSPEVPHMLTLHIFFVKIKVTIPFYILLITAVTAIPEKPLVSIANDNLFSSVSPH